MRTPVALAALLSACGGGDRPPAAVDAGTDADTGPSEPTPPDAPSPPTPPRLVPCPEGWHETPDERDPTIATCAPWPPGGRDDCDAGEAWFPGDDRCAPVGSPCPAGDFADGLPAGDVVFVRPGASGDGSRVSPFGTIAEAIAAATEGGTIALARGTHVGGVRLDRRVTMQGACAVQTTVAAPDAAETAGTIEIAAPDVVLSDLSVTGPRIGVRVDGGSATLDAVVVSGAERIGVRIAGGAAVTARDLVVRGTASQAGLFGMGIQVSEGATLDLVRGAIDDDRDVGIFVFDPDSAATLADVVVAGTLAEESTGLFGFGISATAGGRIDVARTIVEDGHQSGFHLDDATVVAEDVVVRGERIGNGLFAASGSEVTISRATFEDDGAAGILTIDEGTHTDAADVVVRGNALAGIQTFDGTVFSLARAHLSANSVVGLVVGSARESGVRATVDLSDVRIVDTGLASNGESGYGLQSTIDSDVTVARVAIESARSAGVFFTWGSTLRGGDLVVRGTQPRASGRGGYGMETYAACDVELSRVVFDANVAFGLLAFDPGTHVDFADVSVTGTFRDESATHGAGLCAIDGAAISATRFRLEDNVLCGVQIATDGEADLEDGVVSGSLVGANVQVEDYDLARLQRDVVYRDNGVNLDTQALPIPEPGDPP